MASPSPGHRLRPKTSDITDFFRTGNTSRSRAADADEPSSPTFLSEPESLVRKRSSKIPFLGRQRKKSTHSDASTSATSASSAGPSSRQSDSDIRHSNVSRKAEPRPNIPTVAPRDVIPERPLPAVPPTNLPSPSLGSKFAAHFVPSRQKLLNLSPRKPARPPTNEHTSDILSLSISASRATSLDSTSSENRSTTPRPQQPIITVSLPPDNLEGYDDMFTLPTSGAPNSVEDPQLTPTASIRFPIPQPFDSQARDADATVKRRGSRSTPDERSSSRASRISRKHIGSPARQLELDSTDAEDSEAVMSDSPKASPPMNVGPTPIAEKRRTLATMPYTQPRSIMKHSSERPNRPPAFPPPPPPTNPPSSALPGIPSSQTTASRKSNGSPPLGSSASRRQRAQTLSAVPSSHVTFSTPSSSLASTPARRIAQSIIDGSAPASPLAKKATEEPSGKENFDMEKASADQLRQALALRNQQFDELASYLLKITEVHVAEQHALLKKVASLEQEAMRRENEIKGLTWLVTNNPRPGMGMSNAASKSTSALELEHTADRQPSGAKLSSTSSHSNPSEDSGAESHQTTSGAEESYRESGPEWGSGTSGGESSSSSRGRKVKRNHTLMSTFYRSSARSARPGAESVMTLPYSPSPSTSPSTKRSSLSSFGTSPSSSTSSLSLTTLTQATTVTSLTAIPESPAPVPKSQDPVVAAAILATENQREKEERRASRASNRSSASSVTAPSASASYSANLKRTRPPSIAQVLAQSPKMEHGRDKLRSYGTSGSASS
ncbi:hypothetical protein B0H17DRAFT_173637 [Mycena rosella]|uniref:Uncharacterized protein n=1 Tax=Mycena rosella TaxID=1033263 RepID=A0AAD7D0R7_MYCRO|nr:hypothetical protein B0H17DRAFT_173637 [Mycena rosella]